jgi:hypothetical protein
MPYDDSEVAPWWMIAMTVLLHAGYIVLCLL